MIVVSTAHSSVPRYVHMVWFYPFDMHTDGFVPDLDANLFPYFLAEAKSTAFSLLHGGPDPKVEQAARRQKYHLQNDKHNTVTTRKLSKYGR